MNNPTINLPPLTKEERRQQRIVRLILRAQTTGARIGALAERKRLLLQKAADQLGLDQPIALPDGKLWKLIKPGAHYVFYRELDLKEVAKNPRKSGVTPDSAGAASGAPKLTEVGHA